MTFHRQQLVDAFSDSVGQEKAADLIETVCEDTGLNGGGTFDEEQAIEIAVEVANQPDATPFVRTAANTLQTRIRTGNL